MVHYVVNTVTGTLGNVLPPLSHVVVKPLPKVLFILMSSYHFVCKLSSSTNVPDGRRTVHSIVVSPMGNLAAVVDCFGRVLLLDSQELVLRRMWKGVLSLNLLRLRQDSKRLSSVSV